MFSTSLSDEIFSRYRPARVFQAQVISPSSSFVRDDPSSTILHPVTCLDIEPIEGDFAVTAHGKQNKLTLFNARLGVCIQRLDHIAGENGVVHAKFTRRNVDSTVLVTSKAGLSDTLSYTIRLFSLLHGSTLRTFSGHSEQVTNIHQSPVDDGFLSCDSSGEVRIWDAKSNLGCVARLKSSLRLENVTQSQVAYHPSGASFFMLNSTNAGDMTLYSFDMRQLEKGPRDTMQLSTNDALVFGLQTANSNFGCSDFRISPDGQIALVTTESDTVMGVSLTNGNLLFDNQCASSKVSPAVASFTPDGKYFCVQGSSGALVFNSQEGRFVASLDVGSSCHACQLSCFSPRTELLITSGEDATVFWTDSVTTSSS